ncbi:TetR/AcrR family transcriptional regulator [Thaumasiovibrio subtropicus]|uniref:TetR/AcrR family transcriptional regulator n=1 Tax=Thaumasiovibrio subtropicus TaxID=1891207 RepID=UPI00131D9118|nr:TetR/AcrR family transcriptional regulator [Thaumasiovibrio subtropicus]
MSRQQKRLQREREIVHATMKLLNDQGFLDLKMADVAKVSECSMGVVYSHFASKEDLLLGCAIDLVSKKQRFLVHLNQMDVSADMYIALLPVLIWEYNELHPGQYEIMPMACMPSVWKRAASARVDALAKIGADTEAMVLPRLEQIFTERGHLNVNCAYFTTGLMGLTMGIYDIENSGFGLIDVSESESCQTQPMFINLLNFLKGWGIELALSEQDWQLVKVIANDLIAEVDREWEAALES